MLLESRFVSSAFTLRRCSRGNVAARHLRRRRRDFAPLAAGGGGRWRLPDIDTDALREHANMWASKARTMLNEASAVATTLVLQGKARMEASREKASVPEENVVMLTMEEEPLLAMSDITVEQRVAGGGWLSADAVVAIEKFGRLNGLTGNKMQKIFHSLAPETLHNDVRSLVEFCCFRYLSRDNSEIQPDIRDPAFQRLIFITMLAWEHPYSSDDNPRYSLENYSLKGRLVGEEAFVRIAPAVAGAADNSTAHMLYKALVGNETGMSLKLWSTYLTEVYKIHQGRKTHQVTDAFPPDEQLLCIGSSRKRPVLKWEENIAWPGNIILSDKALYFEAIGLSGTKEHLRVDLTQPSTRVEKAKVGPFRSKLFDSAVSITFGLNLEVWMLEFVDFGGEMRRDVWHAFISEVISLYKFIREYGPHDDDPTVHHVYGAQKGKERAIRNVANSIARLQALQYMRKFAEDPARLVQFSYLFQAPYGDVVLQTLAVSFWGGHLITNTKLNHKALQWTKPTEDVSFSNAHAVDIDGSIYLRRWMTSPTWLSSHSVSFWKSAVVRNGFVLGKSLVVADRSLIERASLTCKERSQVAEKTRATIVAATIEGIPSNIDLFKELMIPIMIFASKVDKLRRWEEPRSTLVVLLFAYTIIFRNLLPYVFPMTLMMTAVTMLLLKELREQGRLGRTFGRITIRDQPPSNTIQKIVALKEAIAYMENYLQNLNVTLLKVRTIFIAGQPEITAQVALLLLGTAFVLFVVPFKYVSACLITDLFTRELEFRREMVTKFRSYVRDRWASVHASPVVVLPYEGSKTSMIEAAANDAGKSKAKDAQAVDGAAKPHKRT